MQNLADWATLVGALCAMATAMSGAIIVADKLLGGRIQRHTEAVTLGHLELVGLVKGINTRLDTLNGKTARSENRLSAIEAVVFHEPGDNQ